MFKGVHGEENTQKKKTRKVAHQLTRGIGNLTLEALLAKRNQKPELRKAQREQAIKEAKEAAAKKKAANKVGIFYCFIFTPLASY